MFQDRGCDTDFAPQAHTDTIIPPLEFQSLRIKSHRLEIKIHLRGSMKCTSFRNYRRRQKRNISEGAALSSILVRKTNKVNPLNKEMTAGMATPSLPSASSTESLTEGPGEGAPQIRRFLSTILRSSPFRLGLRRSPKLGAEAQPGSRRVGSPSLQSSRQTPTTPSRRTLPPRGIRPCSSPSTPRHHAQQEGEVGTPDPGEKTLRRAYSSTCPSIHCPTAPSTMEGR